MHVAMKIKSVDVCPSCGFVDSCPICGSKLVKLKYRGHKRSILALIESDGFVCFLGCCRVELHDKVVDGVNCRDKAFIVPLFRDANVSGANMSNGLEYACARDAVCVLLTI